MLSFYSNDEFFDWLPVSKEDYLQVVGRSEEDYLVKYKDPENNVYTLVFDKEDVSQVMELLTEVSFNSGLHSGDL